LAEKKAKKAVAAGKKDKAVKAKPAEKKPVKAEVKEAKKKPLPIKEAKAEDIIKFDESQLAETGQLKVYEVIEYPLITEKAVNMIEAENKLTFVVNKKARKQDVKRAVEALYGVRVDKVNILKDTKSRKRAIVLINKDYKADDIATRLGVL